MEDVHNGHQIGGGSGNLYRSRKLINGKPNIVAVEYRREEKLPPNSNGLLVYTMILVVLFLYLLLFSFLLSPSKKMFYIIASSSVFEFTTFHIRQTSFHANSFLTFPTKSIYATDVYSFIFTRRDCKLTSTFE